MAATKPGLEKLFAALAPAKVNYVMPYAPGAKEQIAQYAKTADVAILNGDLDDSTPSLPDREARMLDYAGGRENAKNLCSPLTIK